jgi:hypothetical protein
MAVELTVLVVSDYENPTGSSWNDVRCTLAALRAQPRFSAVECIVVENAVKASTLPSDLADERVEWVDAVTSYALKNAGARLATRSHVALLDADCVPASDWLDNAFRALDAHREVAAISGLTRYAGRTATERCLGLLSRSYVELGQAGRTRHISNNNALYRREVLLQHPLPENATAFSSSLQSHAMLAAGLELRFDPSLVVTHAFEGWAMERDIRRNLGYAVLHNRLVAVELPLAGLARLGLFSVPVFLGGRWFKSSLQCLRHGRRHGVRWREQPLALGLAAVTTALELPGMVAAVRGTSTGRTAYR